MIAHNRSYCILYYISTYETPVKNLLSSMAPTSAIDYVFKKALAEAKRVSQGNRAITSFFERKRVASGEGEEASGGGKRKK